MTDEAGTVNATMIFGEKHFNPADYPPLVGIKYYPGVVQQCLKWSFGKSGRKVTAKALIAGQPFYV